MARYGARPEAERFWEKVEKTATCWLWTSATSIGGYGRFKVKRDGLHRLMPAHRWSYEEMVGPIPEGLTIDHLCRVRHCVNPAHLEVVTQYVNNHRAVANGFQINASKTHCAAGHPYDEANTYVTPAGFRHCRACGAANARRYKAQRRAASPPGRGYGWRAHNTHCPQGHPFSEENTYVIPSGGRRCRICMRERYQQSKAR